MDTIFALASARGKAGVSVIRVSGPSADKAALTLCGVLPEHRKPSLRRLKTAEGETIDAALVLRFAAGQSFTGEPVVEFQTHGSPAVVSAVLQSLARMPGCRPAEAGEFTRRALENDRLDLAEVEGLAALIEAETEAQRRLAFRLFDGALGELTAGWRRDLIRAAALIEATIDFADEEVPENVVPEVRALIDRTRETLSREISGSAVAERVRDGFEVAIVGAPNAGKSTLLNRLVGRDAAITSEVAGTTRDVVEVRMDLEGLPVTFLDTAGLRETTDTVESIGVDRARARAQSADLRVFLLNEVNEDLGIPAHAGDIRVLGKGDLAGREGGISGLTGAGVDDLLRRVIDVLSDRSAAAGVATHARHRQALEQADAFLSEAVALLPWAESEPELVAETLRSAIRALDSLVGQVDVEHLLDEIFSSFCIGK